MPSSPVVLLPPRSWKTIDHLLDDLIAHTEPRLLGSSFHAALYTTVYNYITSAHFLTSEEHSSLPGLAELQLAPKQLLPARIYCTISNKLVSHLASILNAASELRKEPLLDYYSVQWRNYSAMARVLGHDCACITRLWVQSMAERRDIYTVEALAITQWKAVLVHGLQEPDRRLTKALMDLVAFHRAGRTDDLDLLKSILASLASLGRSGKHGEVITPDVYQDVFEDVFLHESSGYYRHEAAGLALRDVQGYVSEVEWWVDFEEGFANVLPTKESYAKLQTALRDVLIIGHSKLIETYMGDSITQRHHARLKKLYSICLRLGALDHLRENFERLFNRAARSALLEEKDGHLTDARSTPVLEIKGVYSNIVMEDFEKDDGVLEALDRDTTAIIQGPRVGL